MVGKICTVCRSCSINDKTLSFFTYPGDPQRRYEWLRAVGRLDLQKKLDNNKTRGNHRICELHFEQKYVRRSVAGEGRKFLSKDAFPTRNLDGNISPLFSAIVPMNRENFVRPPSSLSLNINILNEDIDDQSSTQSPLPCTDLSEFCESVIKVSKGTQTPVDNKRKKNDGNSDSVANRRSYESEVNGESESSFLQQCYKFLPEHMCQIIKWHFDGRENMNLNLFALNLYFSGNSYNLLRHVLNLPTVDTLKHFLVPKTTQLSENFLNALRIKVNNMSAKERICSFCVGSTILKPNLYYDIKFDRIIGFHDIDGEQTPSPAKYAVILMVQGIFENWKQPVAYAFISEYDNFPEISMWIDEVITTLIEVGLDIRTFVSNPRSEFLYMSESRFVTTDKTYFTINGKHIYYIYDTSQLLKIVKNNSKSCNFFYNCETDKDFGTVDFFNKLNNVCEILNSRTRYSNMPFKRAFCNKKYQIEFLKHMLSLFLNLKVLRKVDSVDVTENMNFINGFQITIKSVLQLFNEMIFLGAKFLLTSRLSHSCLEKLFKRVKQVNGKEEFTPRQFNKCFVRSFVFNLMKKPLGSDSDNSLEVEEYSQQMLNQTQETESSLNYPLKVSAIDYRLGLPEKNAFVYACGYCYLKCIQRHRCDELKAYLKHFESMHGKNDVTYLCSVSLHLNIRNCKILPPEDFTEFLMLLESKFKDFFKPGLQINSVGQEILRAIENCEFNMPCQCFPIDYLKALFVRVRIFYMIRKNNKMFRRKKGLKVFRVFNL